jgi:hypothetical protein
MFGLSKTKLHHGKQTVAASQQLGLGAPLAEQGNCLTDGFGRVVFKTRWNHQKSPMVLFEKQSSSMV